VGANVGLSGGGTNRLSNTRVPNRQEQPFSFFYGAYPSINIVSTGASSVFDASYAFGINQTESSTKLHNNSHALSINLSGSLSQNWRLTFADSFNLTDDSGTFNAFRGVTPLPDDSPFVFEPTAFNISSRTNSARVNADYSLSDKSTVTVSATHNRRDYENVGIDRNLSDQQGASLTVGFRRRIGQRETWSASYAGSYLDFETFPNYFTHKGQTSYSISVAGRLAFDLSVGIADSQNRRSGERYIGYDASARLTKAWAIDSLSVFYQQNTGSSSGLGSISDVRRTGASWERTGRHGTLGESASAY
jgi:hypothetical protein